MRGIIYSAAVAAVICVSYVTVVSAAVVLGGGSKTSDCMSTFVASGANKPALPKAPKHVDCDDGDPSCDLDATRNGECVFDIQVCVNASGHVGCVPDTTDSVVVEHAIDNGDSKFDADWQALQTRIDVLGFPGNDFPDDCAVGSALTVKLRPAKSGNKFRKDKKRLKLKARGTVSGKFKTDSDKIKFTCRPEGNRVYLPTDLYTGTFDRIRQQVFGASCALSGCHDSETAAGGMILLAGAAYSQLVGVVPTNAAAVLDGLSRVAPGNETLSLMYRKITADLPAGYGAAMPLNAATISPDLTEIIRLWILGDGVLGPAPQTGWVVGTDQ